MCAWTITLPPPLMISYNGLEFRGLGRGDVKAQFCPLPLLTIANNLYMCAQHIHALLTLNFRAFIEDPKVYLPPFSLSWENFPNHSIWFGRYLVPTILFRVYLWCEALQLVRVYITSHTIPILNGVMTYYSSTSYWGNKMCFFGCVHSGTQHTLSSVTNFIYLASYWLWTDRGPWSATNNKCELNINYLLLWGLLHNC